MDKADIDKIASAVVEQVKQSKHSFWIDPEAHYQDHIAMRDMVKIFSTTRSLVFRAFIGFAIIGTLALAAFGLGFGHFK